MNIHVGKITTTSAAAAGAGNCIRRMTTPRNDDEEEEYQVCWSGEEHDVEEPVESYDPELDSPSSWTTQSSTKEHNWCCTCPVFTSLKAAKYAQMTSNIFLTLATLAGVVYGILSLTGTLDSSNINDDKTLGGVIIFGAVVGGAVSLILVNVSWWYRHKSTLGRSSCSLAQIGSTGIILFVGAALIPTYYRHTNVVLILLMGLVLPLLVLVNIPMLFDSNGNNNNNNNKVDCCEDTGGEAELEVQPGDNLETSSFDVLEEAKRQARLEAKENRRKRKLGAAFRWRG